DQFLLQQFLVSFELQRLVAQIDSRRLYLRLRGTDVEHARAQRDARDDGALPDGLPRGHIELLDYARDLRLYFDFAARDHFASGHRFLDDGHPGRTVDLVDDRHDLRLPVEEDEGADEHHRDHAQHEELDYSFHSLLVL